MLKDYLPGTESELIIWFTNLRAKMATHGASIGFTPAEIAELSDMCGNMIEYIEVAEAKKNEAQKAVAAKKTYKKEIMPVIRNAIQRGKTSGGYTDAIGQDLNVIGSEAIVSVKPGLKAKARVNDVELSFTKKGLDGVNVYARLKGEAQWTFLSRDTNSPYTDARPLANIAIPETREYMVIGVMTDEEVGDPSNIVTVLFGG